MMQIKSLADLQALKQSAHEKMDTRIKGKRDDLAQVKVAMATCGIAAGAKGVFDHLLKAADEKGLEIILTQSDCMGHCNMEPTVEVILPGKEPVMFGNVDNAKADEILDKYIAKGEFVEGVIARVSQPRSKLATVDYLKSYYDEDVDLNHIYRYMDKLYNTQMELAQQISVEHTRLRFCL